MYVRMLVDPQGDGADAPDDDNDVDWGRLRLYQ